MGMTPQVEQLTPSIGAEVQGLDLRRGVHDDLALVRAALHRHHVVVVREQQLDDRELYTFASYFGTVAPSPAGYVEDTPAKGLYDVNGAEFRASMWHTDLTFEPSPVWLGILAAKSVPSVGGDTMWSNMAVAYSRLSRPFAQFLSGLDAEHTSAGLGRAGEAPLTSVHPVIAARPETGEPVLYVNPLWTQRIVGLEASESASVLDCLNTIALTSPETQLRHRWLPGDVVVWDMRSTMHRAVDDYGTRPRVLRRASVLNEPPKRFDGSDRRGMDHVVQVQVGA